MLERDMVQISKIKIGGSIRPQDGGPRRGQVGGFVTLRKIDRPCLVAPAHLLPGRVNAPGSAEGHAAIVEFEDGADLRQIGKYRSIAQALGIAPIPENIGIDEASCQQWCDSTSVAKVASLLGAHVQVTDGFDQNWGRISAQCAPLWLKVGRDEPVGYHGALVVTSDSTETPFARPEMAGATVYSRSGQLVGFVAAADQTSCILVPAETFLNERHLAVASRSEINAYNNSLDAAPNTQASAAVGGYENLRIFATRISRSPSKFKRAMPA